MQDLALATSGVALGPPSSTWLIYLGQVFSALVLEPFPQVGNTFNTEVGDLAIGGI